MKVKIFNKAQLKNPSPFKYEIMAIGLLFYVGGHFLEGHHLGPFPLHGLLFLLGGLVIISGAVESLIMGVERLSARTNWDTLISATIAEDHALTNLGAVSMAGIYALIVFLLIAYGG